MISLDDAMDRQVHMPGGPSIPGGHPYHQETGKHNIPLAVPVMGSFARVDHHTRPVPTPPAVQPAPTDTPADEADDDQENDQGTDEEAGVIRCICECDDDDGFTIQCDKCFVWQHCACFGMSHSSVPDEYLCEQCDPRPVDVEYARAHQQRRLQEEVRKAQKVRDATAAVAMLESAANAAWNAAIQGPSSPTTQRRRSQGQRSPPRRPVPDTDLAEPPDISTLNSARGKSRSVKKTRGGLNGRRPHASVSRSKHGDDGEYSDIWEAWHMEFTDIETNHVRDQKTMEYLAEYVLTWQHTPRLETTVDDHGFHLVPLRYAQDVHGDIRAPPKGDAHFARYGLAPVGQECVPVHISCEKLEDIGARVHVRSISDQVVNNFFNNIHHLQAISSNPQKIWSASKTFCHPFMHGLFAEAAIPAGAFIVQYRGELYSADAYRADPINQYAKMGTSKPHVRLLPAPLNLVVDARMYGNLARFARTSCHPNAVLRPILQRDGDCLPKLHFGLFALAPIPKSHEITVGWDWDDHHIVHVLPALVRRPWAIDDTPRFDTPAEAKLQDELDMEAFYQRGDFPYASTILATKFQAIVSVLLSYTTCGCLGPSLGGSSTNAFLMRRQNCAVTQMLRVGQGMPLLYTSHILKSLSKPKPIMLAPLVGVFRHWSAEMPMDAETHLCCRLAQNAGYVQRVQRTGNERPVWPPPPMSMGMTVSSNLDEDTNESSDTESVGQESFITEPMSDDEMPFASDVDDPVVTKALQHLDVVSEPAVLPFKKRSDRTRLKAQPIPVSDVSRVKRPARSDAEFAKTDVPAKRQKVRALYDAPGQSSPLLPSSEDEDQHSEPDSMSSSQQVPQKSPESHQNPRPKPVVPRKPSTPPNALLMTAPVRRVSPTTLPPHLTTTATPIAPARDEIKIQTAAETSDTETTLQSLSFEPVPLVSAPTLPPREPTPPPREPTPPPPPPPKRLSLAEYKKRLASRRQSEGKNTSTSLECHSTDAAPASSSFGTQEESIAPRAVSPALLPAVSQVPAPEPSVSVPSLPSAAVVERDAIRSVYIPQSPPRAAPMLPPSGPPSVLGTGSIPVANTVARSKSQVVPVDVPSPDQVSPVSVLHPQSVSVAAPSPLPNAPAPPLTRPTPGVASAPMSLANPPSPKAVPALSATLPWDSAPAIPVNKALPPSPPSRPPGPPPKLGVGALSARPPPPGPPPGPPPPMPARLRAAQQRADERQGMTVRPTAPTGPTPGAVRPRGWGSAPVRNSTTQRGAGFGRGGWRPI
ncbi:Similar to S.cerevisiae protein SET3 (Defining member of the SET3 histone deacetylase complex) [Malassezia sympodialis ATCC 42132]|uniref:Similar to S.cerevisiae protein SET3 (Defining member of the SET3 histone deacetylase complex) n=1 Tax=Malassezia sympodialis (strain ATCC 42132) TaxID=1230383 RepID=A0A1M8AAW0_MALS4|nr:Similar to S.cerevisiae protein SET3 (Defining member of the SET3 histone deacetylase complex) [Malassezia sympodialis ATCC 42132]